MRLGAVHLPDEVNGLYRMVLPMMALQQRGHEIVQVVQERGRKLPIAELADCDLVHMHRLLLMHDDDDCVARLQAEGVAVGFDEDDNAEAAPAELEGLVAEGSLERAKHDFGLMLARVAGVDLVTTPSAALADRFEAAGAENVHVIDNYLPGEFLRVQPAGHEGLVIGWHACAEHRLDAEALGLDDVLRRILDAHPHVHVVTLGVEIDLEHERAHHEESVSFDRLTQRLADFDIGIVPLADTAFNRGRSNVKARELAAAGVPWLASPVGAYLELGKAEGGRLVDDDEWFAALDGLIGSSVQRALARRRAKGWAKRETIWHTAHLWEQAFLDTIDDVRAAA